MFSLLKQEILHKDDWIYTFLKLEVPSIIPACFIYLIHFGHPIRQDNPILSLVRKSHRLLELRVTLQVFEPTVFTSLWDATDWLLSEIQTTLSMLSTLY